jgi:hypothetical protein
MSGRKTGGSGSKLIEGKESIQKKKFLGGLNVGGSK